jgi:hypothetical protein
MVPRFLAPLLLFASVAVARATVVEALPLADLVSQSQRVVLGRVLSVNSAWDPSGMRIHTRFRVDVRETLKGEPSSEVSVFAWGGTVGDVGQTVVGQAEPQPGDEAVFFLAPAPLRGNWHMVGMAQGFWPVTRSEDGSPVVSRKPSRLTLRVPGASRAQGVLVSDPGIPARPWQALRWEILELAAVKP